MPHRPRHHDSSAVPFFVQTHLYRNLALYCLGAVVLVAVSVVLWFTATVGSFWRDALAPAILGAGITAIAAFSSLVVIASNELRERRLLDEHTRAPRETRPALRIGTLTVPDIRLVAAGQDVERRFRFDVAPTDPDELRSRPDPQEWPQLESVLVPRLQAQAAERKQVFFDDDKLDLLDAVRRRDVVDGQPVSVYELTLGVTRYHRFAAMSNSLDVELDAVLDGGLGDGSTLRERWGLTPLSPEHVRDLPCPAAMGCGVVVVTADGTAVLLERAATFIGGPLPDDRRSPVHVVAEGMIPNDLSSGASPLRAAALRALNEELGIQVAEAGIDPLAGLDLVGMFFDTRRWQPCFAWVAHLSVTLDDLTIRQATAADDWESAAIYGVPFDVRAEPTRALLLDRHENLVLTTNHAYAYLTLALLAEHGFAMCDAALSWGAGRRRRTAGPATRRPGTQ